MVHCIIIQHPAVRHKNPKHIHTKQKNLEKYEAKTDRAKEKQTNPQLKLQTSIPHSQQLPELLNKKSARTEN